MEFPEFKEFPKMARMSRDVIISEKIDGTNAQILITPDGDLFTGSRTRWITPADDNHGFARWAEGNRDELLKLGPGRHFGEWWGQGIQRGYGLKEKRLSLFNVLRWCPYGEEPGAIPSNDPTAPVKLQEVLPECVGLVPVLYRGPFCTVTVDAFLKTLADVGSLAAPGFKDPEGLVVFHVAGNFGLKKTIKGDEVPKSKFLK
jgi:hypothetical protein